MMKKLAAAGLLTMSIGGALFTAAGPAMAGGDDNQNTQVVGVQTCRSVDVTVIGAVVRNLLGVNDESGDCANGSVVDD
ncbi:hypothetical protein [Actinomadura flavalba]|uniref:hypothetical protein n=1 Tax=Actinomadura flavalba TaxID=1120938 RepID=UPI0003636586|nr:hypothetical protein [Actinomadura flavalba]